jgi:parallel beta-helix repeat protein
MLIRKFLAYGIIILFLGTCINQTVAISAPIKTISSGNTLYVGGSGEGNYTTIQSAIDDASDGDTVFVLNDSSPYYENLLVNKSLNIMGENRNTTVIDGNENDLEIVYVTANWVNISGFTMQNGGAGGDGISLKEVSNCRINNNIAQNFRFGIRLDQSYNNIVTNNLLINNYGIGIKLKDSNLNVVSKNTITANGAGMNDWYGYRNYIYNNTINNNGEEGIGLYYSQNSYIENNIINNNKNNGIDIAGTSLSLIQKNIFSNNSPYGIYLEFQPGHDSSNNVIINNSFFNDGVFFSGGRIKNIIIENNSVNGLPLLFLFGEANLKITEKIGQLLVVNSHNITILEENISDTDVGIAFYNSNDCSVTNSILNNNRIGVFIGDSEEIQIYNNSISFNNWGLKSSFTNKIGIRNNIINYNNHGIYYEYTENAIISNNKILGNGKNTNGVDILHGCGEDFIISENVISNWGKNGIQNNEYQNVKFEIINNTFSDNGKNGLHIFYDNHLIVGNIFLNNSCGLSLHVSRNCKISGNTFKNNQNGIIIILGIFGKRNIINNNNFFNNQRSALFEYSYRNIWRKNYWDRSRLIPYPIYGITFWGYNWVNFDWHPAKEPYDMEVSA